MNKILAAAILASLTTVAVADSFSDGAAYGDHTGNGSAAGRGSFSFSFSGSGKGNMEGDSKSKFDNNYYGSDNAPYYYSENRGDEFANDYSGRGKGSATGEGNFSMNFSGDASGEASGDNSISGRSNLRDY